MQHIQLKSEPVSDKQSNDDNESRLRVSNQAFASQQNLAIKKEQDEDQILIKREQGALPEALIEDQIYPMNKSFYPENLASQDSKSFLDASVDIDVHKTDKPFCDSQESPSKSEDFIAGCGSSDTKKASELHSQNVFSKDESNSIMDESAKKKYFKQQELARQAMIAQLRRKRVAHLQEMVPAQIKIKEEIPIQEKAEEVNKEVEIEEPNNEKSEKQSEQDQVQEKSEPAKKPPFQVKTFNPDEHLSLSEKSKGDLPEVEMVDQSDKKLNEESHIQEPSSPYQEVAEPQQIPKNWESESKPGSDQEGSGKSNLSMRSESPASCKSKQETISQRSSVNSDQNNQEDEEEPVKKALLFNPFGIQSQVSSDSYIQNSKIDEKGSFLKHSCDDSKRSMTPASLAAKQSVMSDEDKPGFYCSQNRSSEQADQASSKSNQEVDIIGHMQMVNHARRARQQFKEEIQQQFNTSDGVIQKKETISEDCSSHNSKWGKPKDQQLSSLMEEWGMDQIDVVVEKFNQGLDDAEQRKTKEECVERWLHLKKKIDKQNKGNWSTEDDDLLRQKVGELGTKKWKEVASFLEGRNGKQCKERWYSHLTHGVTRQKWTVQEDLKLMELQKQYGNKWVLIQNFMPGRIDNDIKNRYNAKLRKFKSIQDYLESIEKQQEKHFTNSKKYFVKPAMFSKKEFNPEELGDGYIKTSHQLLQSSSDDDQKVKPEVGEVKKVQSKKKKNTKKSVDKDLVSADLPASKSKKCHKGWQNKIDRSLLDEVNPLECSREANSKSFVHTRSTSSIAVQQKPGDGKVDDDFDELGSDSEILIQNLLQFNLPSVLSENKLLFRRIFNCQRLTQEEMSSKHHYSPFVNTFDTFNCQASENTGPKVLYITAKKDEQQEKDPDNIIKDIDGHPIEKIYPTKFSDKMFLEDQQYKNINQAMQSLKKMKEEGLSEDKLRLQAIKYLKQLNHQSEFSAAIVNNQSDKSVKTSKSPNNIANDSKLLASGISAVRQNRVETSPSHFQVPLDRTDSMLKQNREISPNSNNMTTFSLQNCNSQGQKIFQTQYIEKNKEPLEEGKFVPLSLMKDEELSSSNFNGYNSRILDTSGISGQGNYDRSMSLVGQSKNQYSQSNCNSKFTRGDSVQGKQIQINKEGNTASINIVHGSIVGTGRREYRRADGDKSKLNSSMAKNDKKVDMSKSSIQDPSKDAAKAGGQSKGSKKVDTSRNSGRKDQKGGKSDHGKGSKGSKHPPTRSKGTPKDAKGGGGSNVRRSTPVNHKGSSSSKIQCNAVIPKPPQQPKGRTTENSKATSQMIKNQSKTGLPPPQPRPKPKQGSQTRQSHNVTQNSVNTSGIVPRNSSRLQTKKVEEEKSKASNIKGSASKRSKRGKKDESQENSFTSAKKGNVDEKKEEDKLQEEKDRLKSLFAANLFSPEPKVEEEKLTDQEEKGLKNPIAYNIEKSRKRMEMLRKIQNQLNQFRIGKKKVNQSFQVGKKAEAKSTCSGFKSKKGIDELKTRHSQRLRQQNETGRTLTNKAPALKEGEIRSDENRQKEIERLKMEAKWVLEGDCYNYFVTKHIRLDSSGRRARAATPKKKE